MDQNCAYCMEGELVAQFGIKSVNCQVQKFIFSRSRATKAV